MSTKTRRGVVATLAAGAMTLTLAPSAFASDIDPDFDPDVVVPIAEVSSADVYRIADADRIRTAVKASQSRSDWGYIFTDVDYVWQCDSGHPVDGTPAHVPPMSLGDVEYFPKDLGRFDVDGQKDRDPNYVRCEVVVSDVETWGRMDIIVATSDEYADALASAPLADVLDAPILLVDPDKGLEAVTADEIERLAAVAGPGWGWAPNVVVHILGGTNAVSLAVEDAIDDLDGVDTTLRYQGIDRYETAVNIAAITAGVYGVGWWPFELDIENLNVYLTTGVNFPDALAAGAAASHNSGIVLLTAGEELDRRGFTEDFLIGLNDWVNNTDFFTDGNWWDINTSEIFAVGGPSATAAADYDIRLADEYVGEDRYETATLTADATFVDPVSYAVVSGETFPDALVASGWIANADGPLLLSRAASLSPVLADYLTESVDDGDQIVTFGGPGALSINVTDQIEALLEDLFAPIEY